MKLITLRRLAAACSLLFFAATASAATFTVTNTNDSGAGSLRAAILSANSSPGSDTIAFAIGSGHQVIRPLTILPVLSGPTFVDGTTQPGYSGQPLVELDGSLVTARYVSDGYGLLFWAGGSVKGLVINRFLDGPGIYANSIVRVEVASCYVGTDHTGTSARPNHTGISGFVHVHDSVIAGNQYLGIVTWGGSLIEDNRIGVDANESAVIPGTRMVHIGAASNTLIENNTIGGGIGISVVGDSVRARGNYFGTNAAGRVFAGHTGVTIDTNVTWATITGNRFANHSLAGIAVYQHVLKGVLTGNLFKDNGLAIDLGGDGVTLNDDGDPDVGPNNYTNFPVLARATSVDGTSLVTGTLDALPNTQYLIQLYQSANCHPSGYGEAAELVRTFTISTNAAGLATFNASTTGLTPGHVVTAIATSSLEGTSEFSKCVVVEGSGELAFESATASVAESAGSLVVNVRRRNGAVGTVSVSYATANGTALAGQDYSAVSGTLSFADGETVKTISIPITNDVLYEGAQTLTVTLSGASGATLVTPATLTVTIQDDEMVPTVNVSYPSVTEGNSGHTAMPFALYLVAPSEVPLEFTYATAPFGATAGVDYVDTSGSVTFAPGESEKSVVVQVIGDAEWEENESVRLIVERVGWTESGHGTIVNDDGAPFVSAANVSVNEGNTGTVAKITITAPHTFNGSVAWYTISRTAVAGEDFTASSGLVHFDDAATHVIEIPITGDRMAEDHEQFDVKLTYPYPGLWTYEIQDDPVTVTILNDDYGVGPERLLVPAGKSRRALIDLGGAAATEHTFAITSSAPDAVSVPATATIPAGASRTTFEVRAHAAGRREDITVTFPAALGGAAHAIRVWTYTEATLAFAPGELSLYPGQTVTVRASLQPVNDQPVLIALDSGDTVDVPKSFVIAPGGEGSFQVKALKNGPVVITATLPSEHGSEKFGVSGRVADPPSIPTLHSISPNNGSTAGGTVVDIHGALFRTDCTVTFGGVPATMVQFLDTETLKTIAPPHAAGTVDVALLCGTDVATLTHAFTYRGAGPHLSSITPSSGTTAGGTYVRLSGYDFLSSCWPAFDGVVASSATVRDANTIDAVAPPHAAAGNIDVRLLCTAVDALLEDAFTYTTANDPAAHVVNVEPGYGAPGEVVTITGTNFRLDDIVRFDGTPARVLEATPETLTVAVPDREPGRVTVMVGRNTSALETVGLPFTVLESAPPRISRITPSTAAAGAELVFDGTAIRPSYTFSLNGVALTTISSRPTRAVVRIPADFGAGAYPLGIVNAAGQLASIGPAVNITATGLVVDTVTARCATVDGGTDVTIEGRGFANGATVTFDGVPATNVVVVDATKIQARVPANYAGPATITVANPDGTSATLTDAFRYYSPFDPNGGCGTTRVRGVRK